MRLANAVLSIVGLLVTLGCVLALYLEATGFGGAPRDGGVRLGYTSLLLAGAAAGILVPASVFWAVRRASRSTPPDR